MKKWAMISENLVKYFVEQETKPIVEGDWVEVPENLYGFGINWKYNNEHFSPPNPPPVILSRIQLIEALGSNYVSIVAAAKTDVEMEVWLEKFRLKDSFNLFEDSTKTELQFLVTKNIMTQEELNAILNQ